MNTKFPKLSTTSYRKNAIQKVIECGDEVWLHLVVQDDPEDAFVNFKTKLFLNGSAKALWCRFLKFVVFLFIENFSQYQGRITVSTYHAEKC